MTTAYENGSRNFIRKNPCLRQFAFGASALVLSRSQRSDIHLLRLLAHVLLVSGDGLNDEEVAVDDEEQRHEVDEDAVNQDVRSGEHVLGQVIGTTSSHVAFRYVAVKRKDYTLLIINNTLK